MKGLQFQEQYGGGFDVLHHDGLGDLDLQRVSGEGGVFENLFDERQKIRIVKLFAGQIDAHRE